EEGGDHDRGRPHREDRRRGPVAERKQPERERADIRDRRGAGGRAELAPDRSPADERGVDEARAREDEHEVRERARGLDAGAVDAAIVATARSARASPLARRPPTSTTPVATTSTPATSVLEIPCPSTATDTASTSTGASPLVSGYTNERSVVW